MKINKKTLESVALLDKTVVVRFDFNVPVKEGKILDNWKIIDSLETLKYLREKNCKIIILSSISNVNSQKDLNNKNKSLEVASEELNRLLGDVKFCPASIGFQVNEAILALENKQILVLENTKFNNIDSTGEEIKLEAIGDDGLGKFWASLCDVFVNDDFVDSNLNLASIYSVSKFAEESCVGKIIEKELNGVDNLINAKKPSIAIIGGTRISDKIDAITYFVSAFDKVLLSGEIAFTFLKAAGFDVGKSMIEETLLSRAKNLLQVGKDKIVLPVDILCASSFINENPIYKTMKDGLKEFVGLDIGYLTIELFGKYINNAETIYYNGPAGVCEFSNYQIGTERLLEEITQSRIKNDSYIFFSGGDTFAVVKNLYKEQQNYSFFTTCGKNSSRLLDGEVLKGLEFIKNK